MEEHDGARRWGESESFSQAVVLPDRDIEKITHS